MKRPNNIIEYISFNNILAKCQGRMFGSWISRSMRFTADATTNVFTSINSIGNAYNHYWDNNQPVRLTTTDTLPAGLAVDTTYYVQKINAQTFKLLDRRNGTVINITNTGSGTHTIARYTGFAEGDLIENPAYLIESILRDEIYVERDLIFNGGAVNAPTTDDLLYLNIASYYNGSILYDITQDSTHTVLGNDATGLILDSPYLGSAASNDKCYLTNVQGNQKIDTSSFDLAAEKRSNWKFAFSRYSKIDSNTLLNQLCYESHSVLIGT